MQGFSPPDVFTVKSRIDVEEGGLLAARDCGGGFKLPGEEQARV